MTSTQRASTAPAHPFTHAERQALRALRRRYQQERDLFSAAEHARLRFLRWLVRTGRLMP